MFYSISGFHVHWTKTQSRLNIGRESRLPPWRRAALPEPEPGGAEPGNTSPAARHGSANRRRYDSENLRPARMFVSVISCSAILLVRIACSRPQSSAVFPPGRSRRARLGVLISMCRAVEKFCGSRSATPRSMQPEDIGQRGATRPNQWFSRYIEYHQNSRNYFIGDYLCRTSHGAISPFRSLYHAKAESQFLTPESRLFDERVINPEDADSNRINLKRHLLQQTLFSKNLLLL
ncbi:unnamed protein product, partial [Nesidiocoris tenuis]